MARLMTSDRWDRRSGAYFRAGLGGIQRERRPGIGATGWYWYPDGRIPTANALGPYRTLTAAKAAAKAQQERLDR